MKNYFDLTGKYALVVGASSGIGTQYAKALANQGAAVAVAARRVEKLEGLKAEIEAMGGRCIAVSCDVADEKSIINCVNVVKETFGRIDILVNNAGVNIVNEFCSFATEDWKKVLDTNLTGQFIMSREVAKLMKEQNYGKIVNTASVGGYAGGAAQIPYYASKGGVVNFTRALAAELAPYHVTVNAIGPGVFDTEMTHDSLNGDFAKYLETRVPLGRWGNEGELDGILIYFASDASSYCTGQTLYVDGGMVCVL